MLAFYNLPTFVLEHNFFYMGKNLISQNDQSNGLVKKPPKSQGTNQNQLVQNDIMVFFTLVQIG
jgi:hypothetical protein